MPSILMVYPALLLCLILPMSMIIVFVCPRHSKNGGVALSVSPVRACVRPSVRLSVRYQNLVSAQ